MEGGFSESGLYRIQQFTDPPKLGLNPFSWNNISNNLFIEAPAGVGFSYCDTPAGCRHTDTSTANDNLAAVKSFLAAYPEYAGNDFWIAGESYAGVYVPSLAFAVYNYNKGSPAVPVPLKGIMVGNGCIGGEPSPRARLPRRPRRRHLTPAPPSAPRRAAPLPTHAQTPRATAATTPRASATTTTCSSGAGTG
jgi:carboxypeptidase C (cathepsin A)